MHEYLQVLGGVLPIFLLMAVGAVVRRAGILNESADRTLLDLAIYLLLPCLILDHLYANAALHNLSNLLWSPALGFVTMAGSVWVARLCARLYRFSNAAEAKTFGLVAGVYNYGYIPVPLIALLYGPDALAVLFLFNLGCELAFWTVGFAGFMGHSPLRDWRRILTPPVLAILAGVMINLGTNAAGVPLSDPVLNDHSWSWPLKIILAAMHQLGLCSIPLAVLIIGATMADFWSEFHSAQGRGVMVLAIFVRNLLCPIGIIGLAYFLPGSRELKETLVVQAAMPTGVFTLLLARHNGGSGPVALQIIFATSAAAILTLPLWVHWGMSLVLPP